MMRRAILCAGAVGLTLLAAICIPRHLPTSVAAKLVIPATFHAHVERGVLTLRGSLPNESNKTAILQRARELYGRTPGLVVDELAVDTNVGSAAWANNVPQVLPILGHMVERGSIIIDGRTIVISGRVDSNQTKATVLRAIGPLAQTGLELEDHVLAGSPPSTSHSLQKKLNEILSYAPIEFESNTTVMTSRSRATLDQLITYLRHAPRATVEISGHTDKYGEAGYNLQLSRRRAEAVRQYFTTHGLTNRFSAIGYGASRPLSAAQTRTGFQHNRRIELHVKGARNL